MTMTINVAVFLALILETVILYVINLQDYKRTSQIGSVLHNKLSAPSGERKKPLTGADHFVRLF